MLSLDLFDSKFEKKLHEGAVDNTIEHLLKPLSLRAAEIRTQLRKGGLDPKQIDQLEKEYEQLVQKRLDIMMDRQPQTEQQSPQPPAKGLLKGKDLITPQQRVAGATPQKPGIKAAVKDVAGGVKRWLKGEPDQGPTYESELMEYGELGSKALGTAHFVLLTRAIKEQRPKLVFFSDYPEEYHVPVSRDDMILLAKAYNAYPSKYDKLDFVEYVLANPVKLNKLLNKLRGETERPDFELTPPDQDNGKLLEKTDSKKKASEPTKDQVQNLKVQRYLTRVRRQHPAAASDIEAIASDELETRSKTQRAFDALKAQVSSQDKKLQQAQDTNQQQSDEIDDIAGQLQQVSAPAEPQPTPVAKPTVAEPLAPAVAAPAEPRAVAPAVTAPQTPATVQIPEPISAPEPVKQPKKAPTKAKTPVVKKKPRLSIPAGDIDRPRKAGTALPAPDQGAQRWSQNLQQLVTPDTIPDFIEIEEHGGGIGPKQRWQELMKESGMKKLYYAATMDLKNLTDKQFEKRYGISKVGFQQQYKTVLNPAPQQDMPVKETFAMPGATIPRKSLIQGYTVFWNPKTQVVSVTRGGDSEEAAIEQARVGTPSMKNFRQAADRLIDRIESDLSEASVDEDLKQKASAAALAACMAAGGTLQGCATNPSVQGTVGTVRDVGTAVKTAKNMTRAGVQDELSQELRNFIRAQGGDPGSQNLSTLYKLQKRMQGQPKDQPNESAAPGDIIRKYFPDITSEKDVEAVRMAMQDVLADTRLNREQKDRLMRYLVAMALKNRLALGREYYPLIQKYMVESVTEAREPSNEKEYWRMRDSLDGQLIREKNPAVAQILRLDRDKLIALGQAKGWNKKDKIIKEIKDTPAVERAIMYRFMVDEKLRNIALDVGVDKVATAAEDVAYDVGDVGEIGNSDVSGWVRQVLQLLGKAV